MKKGKINNWLIALMGRIMISCEAAGILICKKQHDRLSFRERVALKMHLIGCKLCQRFEEDVVVVQSGINQYKESISNSASHHHLDDKQKKEITEVLEKKIIDL